MSAILNDNLLFSKDPSRPSRMVRTGALIMDGGEYSLSVINAMRNEGSMPKDRVNGLVKIHDFTPVEEAIREEIVFSEWVRGGREPELYRSMIGVFFWWHPYELTGRFIRRVSHFAKQIDNENESRRALEVLKKSEGLTIAFA